MQTHTRRNAHTHARWPIRCELRPRMQSGRVPKHIHVRSNVREHTFEENQCISTPHGENGRKILSWIEKIVCGLCDGEIGWVFRVNVAEMNWNVVGYSIMILFLIIKLYGCIENLEINIFYKLSQHKKFDPNILIVN